MSLNPFSLDIMTSPEHPIYQGCDNYDYSGTHMADRKVVVTLQSPTALDFMIGDYITYNGEKFTLQTAPITTRIHSSLMLAYTLTFWWNGYELQLANFLDVIPSGDDSAAYYNTTSEVIINDTIPVVCGRIIANLDRSGYTGWTFSIHGSVDVTTKKDIEAINVQCYDVLQNMATVFGVEYRFDNATKTIWIGYPPEATTLFEYGKDKGICEINRVQNDQKVITRVRGFGSTRNISANYRKDPLSTEYHPRLMLPEDQVIDVRYSIINGYLVDTVNEAMYGIREGVPYINEDIYPTIEGLDNTVKAVGSINDRPTASTPQYNTIVITTAWDEWVLEDWKGVPYALPAPVYVFHPAVTKEVLIETVPQGTYDTATFFVANLGVDLNDESIYTGTTPKIAFTSGNMSGIEFEIASFTKYMTILNGQPTWDDGLGNQYYKVTVVRDSSDANHILPSAEVPINIGDTYVFLDIFLPDTYENAAEARLLTDTMKYLVANTKSPEGYAIRLAEEYFTKFPLTLGLFKEGNAVTIRDTVLGLTERAVLIQSMSVSYKDNALLPTYNLTISDVPIKGSLDALRAGLKQSSQTITSRINTVESNTNSALKSATILTSRILDNNLDIRGGIIAAQSIEPVSQSIELKSAHYILQALFKVNYEGEINAANGSAGVLIHKEADVVWDNTYDLEHQTWTISAPQDFALLDGVMYYVYVKGSLVDGTAIWVVSETKIQATQDQDYYYFEWGQVLAPIEGSRITQTSYGSTYVTHLPVTVNPASAAFASIDANTQVLTINDQTSGISTPGTPIHESISTIVRTGLGANGESYLIENTTNTSETVVSSWTIVPYNEQVGEFEATVLVRNKALDTIITVRSLLSFDYSSGDVSVILQTDLIIDAGITLTVGVNASNELYATVSGMATDAKRLHFCYRRCILSQRELNMDIQGALGLNGTMELTAYKGMEFGGSLNLDGVVALSAYRSMAAAGVFNLDGVVDVIDSAPAGILLIAGASYSTNRFHTTTNLSDWSTQSPGHPNQEINRIEFINNKWFAGGYLPDADWNDENSMLISSDGETWTAMGLLLYQTRGFAYNGSGTYVAVGQKNVNKEIMYCTGDPTDQANWNFIASTIFYNAGRGVRYIDGRFWALGGHGVSNVHTFAYSTNGIGWTGMGKTIFNYMGTDIAYNGNSTYVMTGQQNTTHNMAYCTGDPTVVANWVGLGKTIFSTSAYRVIYAGGIWVAGGEGTNSLAYCTGDPTVVANWVGLGSTVFANRCHDIQYHNGYFYAVGNNTSSYYIQKSINGINWSNASSAIITSTLVSIGAKNI